MVIDLLMARIALFMKRWLPISSTTPTVFLTSCLGTSGTRWDEEKWRGEWPDVAGQEEQCGNRATVRLGIDQPWYVSEGVCRDGCTEQSLTGRKKSTVGGSTMLLQIPYLIVGYCYPMS